MMFGVPPSGGKFLVAWFFRLKAVLQTGATVKPHLWLIKFIGIIVPRRLRASWRQEWEAELEYRESLLADWDKLDWRNKLALLWHSLGALMDALWLQPRRWEDEMFQDLRFGVRMLLKNPGFALVAIATLALGIGANTAIFSVVNGVLLRPLPYDEPERLLFVTEHGSSGGEMGISYPNFLDWHARNRVFERIGFFNSGSYKLTAGGETEGVSAGEVTADMFAALRVNAALGRVFTNEDDKPGAAPVVLLSHGLWQRRFGGNPQVVGKTITLEGYLYTVIGVAPKEFSFPSGAELWVSAGLKAAHSPDWQLRGNHPNFYAVARLKPGVTLEQARADLDSIAANLEMEYPETNLGQRVRMIPLLENYVRNIRPALRILLGAVSFVLLIACANVASLMLARATGRQKEMAVRAALGAGRMRIIRQLLAETILLSLLGGGLGLAIGQWSVKVILALSPGTTIPRIGEIRLDNRVLLFTAAVSLLTGIIFGLLPALQASRPNVQEALKETGLPSLGAPSHKGRLRSVLLVAQIALTLVLLVCAGLLIRSFQQLHRVAPGFDYENLMTFGIELPPRKYPEFEQQIKLYQQVSQRLSGLPGVQSVGLSTMRLPLSAGGWRTGFMVEGEPALPPSQRPSMDASVVDANYFKTMKIPLLSGRWFNEHDDRSHLTPENTKGMNALQRLVAGLRSVIIDKEFARRYWPNGDAIGQRIRLGNSDAGAVVTVVGIVGRVKMEGLSDISNRVQGYFPYLQFPFVPDIVVRTQTPPETSIAAVRQEVRAIDSELQISNIRTMEQIRAKSIEPQRFNLTLLGIFAGIALALALVGIYGVMAYVVAQRTHEIGIRMALGASPGQVLKLVVGQGMTMVGLGMTIGMIAAFGLTRLMRDLVFGVSATDPVTFGAVPLLLVCAALLACYLPARRATKIDPLVALRHE
jgi:putative ABC transport system permease protein